ncbi:MAG: OmpA family protein [Ottowia sp.]|nr:OmpA family protein [Ottowia sp.]
MNTMQMGARAPLAAMLAAAVLASGCALTETQRDVAIGAGVGAVVGGIAGDGKGAAIGAGVGAVGGYAWSRYMESKRQQMAQATAGTGVQVSQTADNQLQLNIPNDISFATNKSDIQPRLRPILDQFAQGMNQQPGLEIFIVGHADSTGSDAVNDPLSLARANSVRDYLVQRGVPFNTIRTEGRGSRQPIADNSTAAGRAQNRRVEIFLAERAQPQQQQPIGGGTM